MLYIGINKKEGKEDLGRVGKKDGERKDEELGVRDDRTEWLE